MDDPKVGEKWYIQTTPGVAYPGEVLAYTKSADLWIVNTPRYQFPITIGREQFLALFPQETRKKRYWLRFWRNW